MPGSDDITLTGVYLDVETALGREAAIKVAELFGGEMIYFPKMDGLKRPARDKAIRKDWLAGMGYKDIARKYGLTELRIRQILAPPKEEQHSLI